MEPPKYFEPQLISLRDRPGLDERWVQERLAENPKLLGLGELVVKDKERPQPGAGRLDLLLQDPETGRRYEVELQLGRTDETHIIRTIEYWDIERKRYPQRLELCVPAAFCFSANTAGFFCGTPDAYSSPLRAQPGTATRQR
jgi:hypothetical protein